jgi:CRP/FNR family transcriptional regulator, anaerobic regulatory protein
MSLTIIKGGGMYKKRQEMHISCQSCGVAHLCFPGHVNQDERIKLDEFITEVYIVNKGQHIYRMNEKMDYFYAVYSGACKDYYLDKEGNEYINNFYFPGDILALEAVSTRRHVSSAVALADTKLCLVPVDMFFARMRHSLVLLERFIHINSYKMLNDKFIRSSTNAKKRIANFMTNVYGRIKERDTSQPNIMLPMTQLDISNIVGVAYETVSRVLHYFQHQKIIDIKNKQIHIIDIEKLKAFSTYQDYPAQQK